MTTVMGGAPKAEDDGVNAFDKYNVSTMAHLIRGIVYPAMAEIRIRIRIDMMAIPYLNAQMICLLSTDLVEKR